jgi:hypothetical protein
VWSVNQQRCLAANCGPNNKVLRQFKLYYVLSLNETSSVINAVIHNNVFWYSVGYRTFPQDQKIRIDSSLSLDFLLFIMVNLIG